MQIELEIITGQNIKKLENGAVINRYSHIVKGANIGKNVMVGEHCYIAKRTFIGDNTRVQNGVNIWDGVQIGKNCFIGSNVCFNNTSKPQERCHRGEYREFVPAKTYVGDDVTICANVTIIAPCKIGPGAKVGPGSIVLGNILSGEEKNGLIRGSKK